MKIYLSILLIVLLQSDVQKKTIRQDNYDITCYVSVKKDINTKPNKQYYWFKSGEIHNSYDGVGGLVLHDEFKKYYRSKQLAENGNFKYGLKHGEWKTWFENGIVKEHFNWKNGNKHGLYYQNDESGQLTWSGNYKSGKKNNIWINHKTKDTIYYLRDTISITKPKSKISKFLKQLFEKRKKDSIQN